MLNHNDEFLEGYKAGIMAAARTIDKIPDKLDLIDRQSVLTIASLFFDDDGMVTALKEKINRLPSFTPGGLEPGEWIQKESTDLSYRHIKWIYCSKCKNAWRKDENLTGTFNYCPNCGSKNRGGYNDGN